MALNQYQIKVMLKGGLIEEFYVAGLNPDSALTQLKLSMPTSVIKIMSIKKIDKRK